MKKNRKEKTEYTRNRIEMKKKKELMDEEKKTRGNRKLEMK